MNPQDDARFAELMYGLGELFDKHPSEVKVELYFRALSDLSIEEVEQACNIVANTRTITGTFPLCLMLEEPHLGSGYALYGTMVTISVPKEESWQRTPISKAFFSRRSWQSLQ